MGVLFAVFISWISLLIVVEGRQCPKGQYIDVKTRECVQCSDCPVDQIIRRPCTKHKDTVCGPFYEFEFFNIRDKKFQADYSTVRPNELHSRDEDGTSEDSNNNIPCQPITQHNNELSWKHLCFGLITAQVVMLIVVIAYVFIRHFYKRRNVNGKIITVTDSADPLIYYHTQLLQQQQQQQQAQQQQRRSITSSSASSTRSNSTSTSAGAAVSIPSKSRTNQTWKNLERSLHRMFNSGSNDNPGSCEDGRNLYVDPMGRVYCRTTQPVLSIEAYKGDIADV